MHSTRSLRGKARSLSFQLRYGITTLVGVCVVAVSIALIVLATYTNWQSTLALQDARSQVVANKISTYIQDLERKISYLSRIEGFANYPVDLQQAAIGGLVRQNKAYESIAIFDSEAKLRTEVVPYGLQLPEEKLTKAFNRSFTRSEDFIGDTRLRTEQGELLPILTISVPIHDRDNVVAGIVIAQINLKFLWKQVNQYRIGRTGYAYIVDSADTVIAQPFVNASDKATSHQESYFLQSVADKDEIEGIRGRAGYSLDNRTNQTSTVYKGLNGHRVVGAASPIETVNWLAITELPISEALLPLRNLLAVVILVTSLLLPLSIALSVRWSRRVLLPLHQLTTAARQLSDGDLTVAVPVQAQNELGILGQTFNMMADRLRTMVQDLQQANRISEESLAELKQTQVQLVQSEKMSSLGAMVAGVAHEINNPVNFIHANTECLEDYVSDLLELVILYQTTYPEGPQSITDKIEDIELDFLQEDTSKILKSMRIGTERIKEIVKSFRVFSRLDEAAVKDVDIHEGIDSTLLILNSRLKGDEDFPEIVVEKAYAQLPKLTCHAGQVNQVFMNILSNAIDAIRETAAEEKQPCIRIATKFCEQFVSVEIKDNGPGIPSEIQNKIFDPFFTTKPVGKGTGIGMSISYKIITEIHGGSIDLISAPNQGTTFTINLPRDMKVDD